MNTKVLLAIPAGLCRIHNVLSEVDMGWNKEGSTIKAEYLGYEVVGVVLDSRVKYGGKVQYTVRLS